MFGSMYRDFEEDPFFRDFQERHRQQMSSMGSMFAADPFFSSPAARRGPNLLAIDDGTRSRRHTDLAPRQETRPRHTDPFAAMSPFGMMGGGMGMGGMFGNMHSMMGNMRQSFERMANDPNSHSYSSSSVMSYSNTGDGAPKVYQASSSTRQAPGGLKETKRTVRDSEKGLEKMSIGHHVGDRAHIIEKSRDRSGQVEENQEFLNLDEDEAASFNREFTSKTRGPYPDRASLSGPMRHTRRELPALTDSRREHRESRTGTSSRYERDRTPPRPSGPGKGGRKYSFDATDTKSGSLKHRHDDKYDRPPKPDRGVHF